MKCFFLSNLPFRTNVDSSGGECSASGGAMQLSAVGELKTKDKAVFP